eukprot:scaffold23126_cov241-Isochrysis_galbana.AAC.1
MACPSRNMARLSAMPSTEMARSSGGTCSASASGASSNDGWGADIPRFKRRARDGEPEIRQGTVKWGLFPL